MVSDSFDRIDLLLEFQVFFLDWTKMTVKMPFYVTEWPPHDRLWLAFLADIGPYIIIKIDCLSIKWSWFEMNRNDRNWLNCIQLDSHSNDP